MSVQLADVACAFPDRPRDPAAPLLECDVDDDEGVSDFFGDRRWREISPEDLRLHAFAPTVFSSAALAYFTPAYITAYIAAPDRLDSACESFIINLGAPDDPALPQFARARNTLGHFTAEQLEVVRRFLELFARNEGTCAIECIAGDALALYGCTPHDAHPATQAAIGAELGCRDGDP